MLQFKAYNWKEVYENMYKPAFLFDGRNVLPHAELKEIGFHVHAIGRRLMPDEAHVCHCSFLLFLRPFLPPFRLPFPLPLPLALDDTYVLHTYIHTNDVEHGIALLSLSLLSSSLMQLAA